MNFIVLAAGEGKRMNSSIPKPLVEISGKPMILWLLDEISSIGNAPPLVVIGFQHERVMEVLGSNFRYVFQEKRLGTANAVKIAVSSVLDFERESLAVVLCGDMPLIKKELILEAISLHKSENNSVTIITSLLNDSNSYGKIVREEGKIKKIIEFADASFEEKQIQEINSGIYVFQSSLLLQSIDLVDTKNNQNEYYLTDLVEIIVKNGGRIGSFFADFECVRGVNDGVDLLATRKVVNRRILNNLIRSGVDIFDDSNTYVDFDVIIESGSKVMPFTTITKGTMIAHNSVVNGGAIISSKIGDNSFLFDSYVEKCSIGSGCSIRSSHMIESCVGNQCFIGPFAHLRPKNRVEDDVRIGNFVELKKSSVGIKCKISHLSYVGDAEISSGVNMGCGSIVVNYNGKKKNKCVIGSGVFVGCNSNLISPISIGDGAYIAAGSTITESVPERSLAIARSRQVVKYSWRDKFDE